MSPGPWAQGGHGVRFEWGPAAMSEVAAGGVVVVVDVLSFTTSVTVAVERGTRVLPTADVGEAAQRLAAEHDAALAIGRREVSDETPWSLSPDGLRNAPAPERLVLPSPNGSTIAATATGTVVAASLRNASAVARWLRVEGHGTPDRPVTVVAAGERWPDGSLRPALEDLLGAAAVLAGLDLETASPEAVVARTAWLVSDRVPDLVRGCGSGRELIERGFGADVDVAVELDRTDVVPVLVDGAFTAAG